MFTTHSLLDSTEDITPTLGFANGSARMSGCDVTLLDLGGNSRIRDIWDNYYAEVSVCMGVDLSVGAWGQVCQSVHGGRSVSRCMGVGLSVGAWGQVCQSVHGGRSVSRCMGAGLSVGAWGQVCQSVHGGRSVSQYTKDTVLCSTSQLQLLMCNRSTSRHTVYCVLNIILHYTWCIIHIIVY